MRSASSRLRVFAHLLNAHTAGQLFFICAAHHLWAKKLKAVEHKKSTRTHLFLSLSGECAVLKIIPAKQIQRGACISLSPLVAFDKGKLMYIISASSEQSGAPGLMLPHIKQRVEIIHTCSHTP
jgi:hypothetical protein